MHWFIRTDGHGQITRILKTTMGQVKDHAHEGIHIKHSGERDMLRKHSSDALIYHQGKLHKKPVVRLTLSKNTILPDSKDMSFLTITGLPDDFQGVNVQLGHTNLFIPKDEPLELTSSKEGVITITLKEPKLTAEKVRLYIEGSN